MFRSHDFIWFSLLLDFSQTDIALVFFIAIENVCNVELNFEKRKTKCLKISTCGGKKTVGRIVEHYLRHSQQVSILSHH